MKRTLWWLALGLVVGCSGSKAPTYPDGGADPCGGPCPAGQACDPGSRQCVAALAEGSRCGPDAVDGGPAGCLDGLDCGPVVGGLHVCSRSCARQSDCPSDRTCVQATVGADHRTYCVARVGEGATCNPEKLQQCAGATGQTVGCIVPSAGGDGTCFLRCGASTDCPAGKGCTSHFSDGLGICVAATAEGDGCDQAALRFCTDPQLCVVESHTRGVCHLACAADGGCPDGEDCVSPDPCAPSYTFCVNPSSIGGPCDPAYDRFCGAGADCVNLNGALTCQPDCTADPSSCTTGSCHPLPLADGGTSCRSACF